MHTISQYDTHRETQLVKLTSKEKFTFFSKITNIQLNFGTSHMANFPKLYMCNVHDAEKGKIQTQMCLLEQILIIELNIVGHNLEVLRIII